MNREDILAAAKASRTKTKKVTITVDEDLIEWVEFMSPNKSGFITGLIAIAKNEWEKEA